MPDAYRFFITCARGVEDLLLAECGQQGIADAKQVTGGVAFSSSSLQPAYRMCLWSRVGSRVLLQLLEQDVDDADGLYRLASEVDWSEHMAPDSSIAIDCFTAHPVINNSQYAALRVKDAVVDQMRSRYDARPSISKQQPDVRINVWVGKQQAILYIDLSGDPLHKRGYRISGAVAPLRETLAAAMLYRCKWERLAAEGASFVDIMCGSGTLLIEAAAMAAGRASQLKREYFGFLGWSGHDADSWQQLQQQARKRESPTLAGAFMASSVALGSSDWAGI